VGCDSPESTCRWLTVGLGLDVDDWTPESTHRLWRHCLPALPFPAERNEQLEFTRAEITGERWARLAAWAATPNSEALLHAAGTARPPRTRASFVPHPSPFAQLRLLNPQICRRLDAITAGLHARGKLLYPNAAAYTAAACLTMKLPNELAALFFIQGRIETYAQLYLNLLRAGPRKEVR
jgi:hypothetical protein